MAEPEQRSGEPAVKNGHAKGTPVLPAEFGTPLDPKLLEEPKVESRPFPVRPFAFLLLPFAGLAASRGVQWLTEGSQGPSAAGDTLLRWVLIAAALGLPLGWLAGRFITKTFGGRAVWVAWGTLSPAILAFGISGTVAATHPLREWMAKRGEARCRLTRKVCQSHEFRAACEGQPASTTARAQATDLLGPPIFERCDTAGCLTRWQYTGPWTPDDWVAPGSIWCTLVTDPSGKATRTRITPGTEPVE